VEGDGRSAIRRYLDEHGGRFTTDALRGELIQAGHDPAVVDEELRGWQERVNAPSGADAEARRFRRWSLLLHGVALAAVFVAVLALGGMGAIGLAVLSAAIVAIFLAIGWVISWLIGRAILPRAGLAAALILPTISALGLGATCLALVSGFARSTPIESTGTLELRLDPPLAQTGEGDAFCQRYWDIGGFNVFAEVIGADADRVIVQLNVFRPPAGTGAPETQSLSITFDPGAEFPRSFSNDGGGGIDIEADADGERGTATFDALPAAPREDPGAPLPTEEPISGSITWDCSG